MAPRFEWRDGSAMNAEIVNYPFKAAMMKRLERVTSGEILLEEWLKPMGVSQYRLALEIGVSPRRINEIVHGKRAITADTALRLARFFGTDAQSWLNLQSHFDMEKAEIDAGKALQNFHADQDLPADDGKRVD